MIRKHFIWLLVLPFLTACFEIKEEIKLRKDGSGNYAFTLDMSQLVTMAEAFREESEEDSPSNKLLEGTAGSFAKLEGIRGISNVQETTDEEAGVLSVSFDFRDMDALNEAFRKMSADSTGRAIADVMVAKKGTLTRRPTEGFMIDQMISGAAEGIGEAGEDEATMQVIQGMFAMGNYSLRIEAPQKLMKFDHPKGSIEAGKAAMVKVSLDEMFAHPEYLTYTIHYK
ncbi:MAG: hypothetical protein ACFCUI_01400 [Bernardetiaceae bacterium]